MQENHVNSWAGFGLVLFLTVALVQSYNVISLKWFLMVKLGFQGIIYWILKPLAPFFYILPVCREFPPANREKKNWWTHPFFWRGLHRKWKLFWNTQRKYFRMKAVNVEENKLFQVYFFIFSKYFWKILFF